MGKVIMLGWEIPAVLALLLLVVSAQNRQVSFDQTSTECGVRVLGAGVLIVDGITTKPGDWPWHVALFRLKPDPVYACGGSIISKNFVLTAAHCFEETDPTKYTFKVGVHHLQETAGVVNHTVREIFIHPQYDRHSYSNDIALIRPVLEIYFQISNVRPICLFRDNQLLQDNLYGKTGIVVGFGRNENNTISKALQQTSIKLIRMRECRQKLPPHIAEKLLDSVTTICGEGQERGSNVCEGDSGGGFYFGQSPANHLVWYLKGVVSFGSRLDDASGKTQCDKNRPAVYTNVSPYIKWIEAHENILADRNLLDLSKCGTVKNAATADETDRPVFNQYPWNALLEFRQLKKGTVHLVCSGVLVHARYVLTVGHCTDGMFEKYQLISVRLGEFNLQTAEDTDPDAPYSTTTTQSIPVDVILQQPDQNKPMYSNNLALVKLKYDADTSKPNIEPICLPSLDDYKQSSLTLSGWKRNKKLFPQLERDPMNITSAEECRREYGRLDLDLPVTKDIMCAIFANRTKGKCHNYATGSPLHYIRRVEDTPRYFMAGLMVFNLPYCRQTGAEMFVNLNTAADWIKREIIGA